MFLYLSGGNNYGQAYPNSNMTDQVFECSTQYKFAVLRVFGFGAAALLFHFGANKILIDILPDSWMIGVAFITFIPIAIFLQRYTHSVGKYQVTVKTSLEGMFIAPLWEEENGIMYPWPELKEFRLITFPLRPGNYGVVYIKWRNGDSRHFSGQDAHKFYQYLEVHFPKKEWRFLGAPKKPTAP